MLNRVFHVILALSLATVTACGDDDPPNNKPPAFVVPSGKTLEQVTVHLEPGILGTGRSQDGKLSLVVPTGAVAAPTDITIARLDPASRPKGVVGDVYVLGPTGTNFLKPIRLRLHHPAAGAALRPVHLDNGTPEYAVLDNWVYVDGTSTFAADLRHLSAFGVSDGSGPEHRNDSAFTTVQAADEALAQGAIAVARDLYEAAATADPNNLQAHLGAALTGLVLLPEHAAVDDILVTACGEVPLDVQGLLFGPDGALAHEIEHRQGQAALTIEKGPVEGPLSPIPFAANRIAAGIWTDDEAMPPEVDLEIRVSDRKVNDLLGEVVLFLDIDASDASWQDGGVVTLGPNSNFWANLWIDDEWDEMGDRYDRLASGSLQVIAAGDADGERVAVELQDVTFERVEWSSGSATYEVVEIIVVNGLIDDVFHKGFNPAPGSLPFDDLEYLDGPPETSEPVQALEQCGAAMTEPFLKTKLDTLMDEVARLRSHLDLIVAHANANAFTWTLPVATVGNGIAIPVGIVEVHAARALLFGAAAINELMQVYRFINPAVALDDLMGTFDRYEEWCDMDDCYVETTSAHDVDLGLLFAALDGYFLTPVAGSAFGAADVAPVKSNLENAINALIAGLSATPNADALFNFRRSSAEALAADELVGFGNKLIAALSVDTALSESPEWILRFHNFFTNPFSAASLLADPDLAAPDNWLWRYTAPLGNPEFTNAELTFNEKALFVILGDLLTLPEFPEDPIYCEFDNECPNQAQGGQDYWRCVGNEDTGVCSHNRQIFCDSWSECDTLQSGSYCIWDSCAPREPQMFNYDLVEEAYDGDPPTFINQTLVEELADGF